MNLDALRQKILKGVWAVADQGVVSLGNFLTAILLARSLPAAEYGVFTLAFGAIIMLNTVHGAIVSYSVYVSVAPVGPRRARELVISAVAASVVTSLVLGVIGGIGALFTGRAELVGPALLALIAWQLQETVRSGLLAHLRFREAVIGDAVSYLGQVIAVWAYANRFHTSVTSTLLIIAVTSTLGGSVQAIQLRLRGGVRWRSITILSTRAWRDGRWLLGNRAMGILTAQSFVWVLAVRYGVGSVGTFQALLNLLAFSHPVLFGVSNAITAAVAKCRKLPLSKIAAPITPYCAVLVVVLLPYFLALLVAPEFMMATFYGSRSPHIQSAPLLRILVIGYVSLLFVIVPTAILNGLSRAGSLFIPQCVALGGTILWGVPMTLGFGLGGAAVGLAGVNMMHGTACLSALYKSLQGRRAFAAVPAEKDEAVC